MRQLLQGQLVMTCKKDAKKASIRVVYRDPIYIRKDIISTLLRHGELNQSRLVSYSNLNNTNHGQIIHDLVQKGLITKAVENWGSKVVIKYRVSEKGKRLMREIMLPYEELFPRAESANLNRASPDMSEKMEGK